MFEEIFKQECGIFTTDDVLIQKLWREIENAYSSSARYYHNMAHLDHLAVQLSEIKNVLNDWLSIVLAVAYHDIVYNTVKKDNEEKSADLGFKRLSSAGLTNAKAEQCRQYILATKNHGLSADSDCNYFTDADLSILGADNDLYIQYTKQIRKEYKYYPDLLYRPGRKKVLAHFLNMSNIFKTKHFRHKYEQQARANILSELKSLS